MNNWRRPNNPELDATKIPTEIDIAWSAGIYEGEGCCRLCGKSKRGFAVQVAQKDPELLYRLRDWFGGSVNDNGSGSGCNNWDCCGDRGRLFIALIYKFLTVRRKAQVDATGALDFLMGQSSDGMTINQLKERLNEYYVTVCRDRRRVSHIKKNGFHVDAIGDPVAMKELLTRTLKYRKDMTPEERESYSKYQHERYERRKQRRRAKDTLT